MLKIPYTLAEYEEWRKHLVVTEGHITEWWAPPGSPAYELAKDEIMRILNDNRSP